MENKTYHPAVAEILRFFDCTHLPFDLRRMSEPFEELAMKLANDAPDCAEKTVALRKLLEAKDAAVRSVLPRETVQQAAERGAKS